MVIETGSAIITVGTSLVDTTKNTDGGSKAAVELGQTALTVTKLINNALLPVAAVNYAFDRARAYFTNAFADDLAEATHSIPREHLKEPKPSVAAPVLQGLAFSHEETSLRQMYLNLLRSAMDDRAVGMDHPSFSTVIGQLSPEEAVELKKFLSLENMVPIVNILQNFNSDIGFSVLRRHVVNVIDKTSGKPVVIEGLAVMVDNWRRLGVFEVSYDHHLTQENSYNWCDQRPEYLECLAAVEDKEKISFGKGVLRKSDFGALFAKAIL